MNAMKEIRLIEMLKALADESRLKIIQRLNQNEATVGELALELGLGEPTISHHLARLRECGLVTLRMAGNQRYYRIHEKGLEHFKQLAAQIEQPPETLEPAVEDDAWIAALGWQTWEEQILRKYTQSMCLVRTPVKEKDLKVILSWLAMNFSPDSLYDEVQVNEILKKYSAEDYVTLRRELVDYGYLRRERGGGKYWLTPAETDSPLVLA